MNRADAVALILYAGELWPNYSRPRTDGAMEVRTSAWLDVLADADAGVVRAAMLSAQAAGSDFAPTPGQLRLRAIALVSPEDLAPDLDVALAEIRGALGTVGQYRTPAWSHPAIAATVETFGGWKALCGARDDGVMWGQLRRYYETAATRTTTAAVMPPAAGDLVAAAQRERLANLVKEVGRGEA